MTEKIKYVRVVIILPSAKVKRTSRYGLVESVFDRVEESFPEQLHIAANQFTLRTKREVVKVNTESSICTSRSKKRCPKTLKWEH